MSKINKILILLIFMASCSSGKKNPLLIPPDYDKIVKEEKESNNSNENEQNNKELIELKNLLLKN
jgi:predicted small lipoprotein YifL